MYCTHCGNQIQDNAAFCPYCGQPVRLGNPHTEEDIMQNPEDCFPYRRRPAWKRILPFLIIIPAACLIFLLFYHGISQSLQHGFPGNPLAIGEKETAGTAVQLPSEAASVPEDTEAAGAEKPAEETSGVQMAEAEQTLESSAAVTAAQAEGTSGSRQETQTAAAAQNQTAAPAEAASPAQPETATPSDVSSTVQSDATTPSGTTAEETPTPAKEQNLLANLDPVNFASLSERLQTIEKDNLQFYSCDVSEYPIVRMYYSLSDDAVSPVTLTAPAAGIVETISGGAAIERTVRSIQQLQGHEGLNIDIVADTSSSMENDLPQMQQIMQEFVSGLDFSVGDRAEVISFDTYVYYMCTYTNNLSLLVNGIQNMSTEGDTAVYDALITGITNAGRQEGAKCVIGFTDGEDNSSAATADDVIAASRTMNVPVYIIGTSDADADELTYITEQTGGDYWNIDAISDLSGIMQEIYGSQKDLYCIEYDSDPNADATAARTVSCVLEDDSRGGVTGNVSFTPAKAVEAVPHDSWYEIVKADVTWQEANEACLAKGGHLITITSEEEEQQAAALAQSAGLKYVWIGGYTSIRGSEAYGHWVTGEPFEYAAWYPGEPSRSDQLDGETEQYLMLWYVQGQGWSWNDQRNDVLHIDGLTYFTGNVGYICEYEQNEEASSENNPTEAETAGTAGTSQSSAGEKTSGMEVDKSFEIEPFRNALSVFLNTNTLPDGRQGYSMPLTDPNGNFADFAVCDIDGDGKDELLISQSYGCNADMVSYIYDYHPESGQFTLETEEGGTYKALHFYRTGYLTCDASHNQGPFGGPVWPYDASQYQKDTDSYQPVWGVASWNVNNSSEAVYNQFPFEKDLDGNGVLYMVYSEVGDTAGDSEPEYLDDAEYQTFISDKTNPSDEIVLEPYILNQENLDRLDEIIRNQE